MRDSHLTRIRPIPSGSARRDGRRRQRNATVTGAARQTADAARVRIKCDVVARDARYPGNAIVKTGIALGRITVGNGDQVADIQITDIRECGRMKRWRR